MSMEAAPMGVTPVAVGRRDAPSNSALNAAWNLKWTPIVVGALTATALSLILITFAATVGLGVSSAAPTWRDASWALWLVSGVYLILPAVVRFGLGGFVAG